LTLKIPKKYEGDLSVIRRIYENIESTHKGLGRLAIVEVLSDASNRALLVVGSSGTGKSTVMKWLSKHITRKKYNFDAITVTGLRHLQKEFNNANASILIDDLSKGGTEYSQVQTVVALAELVYSGYVTKFTSTISFRIYSFQGSAIMNCQPLLFRRIIRAPEFETDIRDKVIRWYHLRRPVTPMLSIPKDSVRYQYRYETVEIPSKIYDLELYDSAYDMFRFEFSDARAEEHLEAWLRASAYVNGRNKVSEADVYLVFQLSRNFQFEYALISKDNLEGRRDMNVNLMPVITTINTFKAYPFTRMLMDYGVKTRRLYEILKSLDQYVDTVKGKDDIYIVPKRNLLELLRELGEW